MKLEDSLLLDASTVEGIKSLLADGANVNAKDEDGETPLMKAVSRGNIEQIKLLIDAGADINAKDRWGGTALMYALPRLWEEKEPDLEIVKLLIYAGADVCAKDKGGLSCLRHAIREQASPEIIKILVSVGAGRGEMDKLVKDVSYMKEEQPEDGDFWESAKTRMKYGKQIWDIINSADSYFNPQLIKNIETKKHLKSATKSVKGKKSGVVFADAIAEMKRSGKIKGDVTPEMAKKLRTQWMKDMKSNGKK